MGAKEMIEQVVVGKTPHQVLESSTWTVLVHFGTGTHPEKIGSFPTRDAAEREARMYGSDSQGVWIVSPDGERWRMPAFGQTGGWKKEIRHSKERS